MDSLIMCCFVLVVRLWSFVAWGLRCVRCNLLEPHALSTMWKFVFWAN